MSMSTKPSNPELFEGCQEALTINTLLHQVDVYPFVIQVVNPQVAIDANTKISFTSIHLKGAAASRWYMLVQSGSTLGR